ncbi:MAG TPA: FAD binding domain-containing protein [Paracoccaceae bacterium]|nr:FAD binding domain-containing protein [Paracoccaceae bacterium]
MYAFDFVKPASVEEALKALQTEDAQALGGGQTLIPALKQRLAAPSQLVSLADIEALKGVKVEGGAVVAGGAATHHAIAEATAEAAPSIAALANRIGDPAVRHRGTIGGSLANNDPSACWPAAALALGATIKAQGPNGTREIAADDFFEGMFATALGEGELIVEVRMPVPARGAYAKFPQPASRFALVGVFVAEVDGKVRVAVTGASEGGVFRWTEAEEALSSNFSADALEGLSVPADGMIGDLHGDPAYRAHLVKVMTRRAVASA